jgi:hypothetical protein
MKGEKCGIPLVGCEVLMAVTVKSADSGDDTV